MAQRSGAAALNVLASPLLFGNRQLIMDRVAALRLPAIYQFPEMQRKAVFAAYGPSATGGGDEAALRIVEPSSNAAAIWA